MSECANFAAKQAKSRIGSLLTYKTMSELAPLISDLGIILIVAGCVTILFKWLNQPVILGYIVAGFLTGPALNFFPHVTDTENIQTWADIGVIFLLFSMGLEFSFRKLLNVGLSAVIATLVKVGSMMFLGYIAGMAMGFTHISSLFLGGMLSMASTAIVFKAFNDMNLLQQKFTGIVMGILVMEDLVGVVMLVMLSTLAASQHFEGSALVGSLFKLIAFLVFWSALGIYVLPTVLKKFRRFLSDEILLLVSLGLCLLMVMIAVQAGFSSALGAFVMGSLLAETIESERITQVVQPVKDLFAAIFFVSVGMMIDPAVIAEYIVPILILTLLVLCGQTIFGFLGVLLSGQSLKVAVHAGFSLAQVGEFSFIIASLGVSLNVTDSHLYPIIVAVSVITTFFTPYMIRLADPACNLLEKYLPNWIRQMLARYASGSMSMHHQNDWNKLLKSMFLGTSVYLIICIVFIVLFFSQVYPFIQEKLPGIYGNLLGAVIVFSVISPLLWVVISKKNHSPEFRRLWSDNRFNRGALVSLVIVKVIICAAIVMSLVVRLFNVASGVGLIIAIAIIASFYFSKRLRKQSQMIEERFSANFNGSEEKTDADNPVKSQLEGSEMLSNLHMADFTISPESDDIGKTLKEIAPRTRYRVNVISIQRGGNRIDVPQAGEAIYPYDKVTAVGTDDDLNAFREALSSKKKAEAGHVSDTSADMNIKNILLAEDSPAVNRAIRDINPEGLIILGIERNNEIIMNPSPDIIFRPDDVVWMVGKSGMEEKFCTR